jgi:DNA helicase HerA-like ATPase
MLDTRNHPLNSFELSNLVSRSLLFSLGREYLGVPLEKASFIQPVPTIKTPSDNVSFLRLLQLGQSDSSIAQQVFASLQTALAACHQPGQQSLIFLISSDGKQEQIFLGVKSRDMLYPAEDFVKHLGLFLEGNWPGTRFVSSNPNDAGFKISILEPLQHRFRYGSAITGIPSLKSGDQTAYPQSLDRFLRGMRGKPYLYMIIAEPLADIEIQDIIFKSRDLLGRIHTLTKSTLTETETVGTSTSNSHQVGKSITDSISETKSDSKSEGWSINLAATAGAILATTTLSAIFPPAAFYALLSAIPGYSKQKQSGTSIGTTKSLTDSVSDTLTDGWNESVAKGLGKEYINAHAKAVEVQLERYIERFEKSRSLGCWNIGAYLLAESPDIVRQGTTQLRALFSGEKSSFEPIRTHDLKSSRLWKSTIQPALEDFEQPSLALVDPNTDFPTPRFIDHPLGGAFNGLTTPLNTEELALLINLPQREIPGVQLMPVADFSLNPPPVEPDSIVLGTVLDSGEATKLVYPLHLVNLTKHVLITGITGSGKSTTCRKILNSLNNEQKAFLVIEPAKDEYLQWAIRFNETLPNDSDQRIKIYAPGVDSWRGKKLVDKLKLNPFDIVWPVEQTSPQILQHIDRLKSILNASFPMQEVLPILMEDLLYNAYRKPFDWLSKDLSYETPRPTLSQLEDQIYDLIQGKGYEQRVKDNLAAALSTRISSLRRGWKGELFDQERSTHWKDIFDCKVVINLSHLGDDADKAFAMALILQFLYEYRQAQQDTMLYEQDHTHDLNHVTVIEEAHRILLKAPQNTPEYANPQAKVAEMFSNVLSEVRAYGEGFVIVDQVPARLIPDAIKNTNLKIVHRLVSIDDQDAMASSMNLTTDQKAIFCRLKPGQAIIYGDLDEMATWIQTIL